MGSKKSKPVEKTVEKKPVFKPTDNLFKEQAQTMLAKKIELLCSKKALFERLVDQCRDSDKPDTKLAECILDHAAAEELIEEYQKMYENLKSSKSAKKNIPKRYIPFGVLEQTMQTGCKNPSKELRTIFQVPKGAIVGLAQSRGASGKNENEQVLCKHKIVQNLKLEYHVNKLNVICRSASGEQKGFRDFPEIKQSIEQLQTDFSLLVLAGVNNLERFCEGLTEDLYASGYITKKNGNDQKQMEMKPQMKKLLKIIHEETLKPKIAEKIKKVKKQLASKAAKRGLANVLSRKPAQRFATYRAQRKRIEEEKRKELQASTATGKVDVRRLAASPNDQPLGMFLVLFLLALAVLTFLWRRFSARSSAPAKPRAIVFHGSEPLLKSKEIEPEIDLV